MNRSIGVYLGNVKVADNRCAETRAEVAARRGTRADQSGYHQRHDQHLRRR